LFRELKNVPGVRSDIRIAGGSVRGFPYNDNVRWPFSSCLQENWSGVAGKQIGLYRHTGGIGHRAAAAKYRSGRLGASLCDCG
jgi:hypothetical protein